MCASITPFSRSVRASFHNDNMSKENRHDRNECNKRILLHMPELAWGAAIRAKAREGEVRESCASHAVQHELPQARSLPERELPWLCSLDRIGVRVMEKENYIYKLRDDYDLSDNGERLRAYLKSNEIQYEFLGAEYGKALIRFAMKLSVRDIEWVEAHVQDIEALLRWPLRLAKPSENVLVLDPQVPFHEKSVRIIP